MIFNAIIETIIRLAIEELINLQFMSYQESSSTEIATGKLTINFAISFIIVHFIIFTFIATIREQKLTIIGLRKKEEYYCYYLIN